MDRAQWLTMVYREANIFIERNTSPGTELTPTEVEELVPELSHQLQEMLSSVDSLEDVIKHSLLKNPPPDLWYGEQSWSRVLVGVASTCLLHDVKGVAIKILEGVLPKTPSEKLLDKIN
jgi:hypothetical protein